MRAYISKSAEQVVLWQDDRGKIYYFYRYRRVCITTTSGPCVSLCTKYIFTVCQESVLPKILARFSPRNSVACEKLVKIYPRFWSDS